MKPSELDLLDRHGFSVLDVVDIAPRAGCPHEYELTGSALNTDLPVRAYRVALVVVDDGGAA